ncbi:unnamed protein product [Ectocarpus sp. CCAP 1310/34]|nr:unnamed protein product [Ectocarpus sp. CCAP 1310/34]
MKAAAAVVVLVLSAAAVVTSVAVHASANKTRAAIHEPRRLVWKDHAADLKKRKLFRRMYRIEEPVFNKLAGLLEPILQRNDYYARKRCRRGAVPTKIRLFSYRPADDGRCFVSRCRRAVRRVQGDGLQHLVVGGGCHQQHSRGWAVLFSAERG